MKSKKELRAEFTQRRSSIDKGLRDDYSNRFADRLLNSEFYRAADTVFIYVSVGSELGTHKLIDRMLADGKTVAVPLCDIACRTMQAVVISGRDDLADGAYGIPEPGGELKILEKSEIDLCIAPALAYDGHGMRLGYGAGYYDRFLDGFDGKAVGAAFEECLAEGLPCDTHDRAVDAVITPQRIIKIRG